MVTDLPSSFEHSFLDLAGVAMARKAAADCYRSSGLTPYDVNVIEVHDCFSCNEVSLDFLGLIQMHMYISGRNLKQGSYIIPAVVGCLFVFQSIFQILNH